MKKVIQLATPMWRRLTALFAPITRFGRAVFAKTCALCALSGAGASGPACDYGRAAVAGMILFGIAGAGMGASGGISAYGVSSSAAGATVAVGWGPYWLLWTIVSAASGAAVGAATVFVARLVSKQRGAATALLIVGALGGLGSGATWGSAVARERIVEVRAQQASAKPMIIGSGARLSVVNGPVRLTGSVARNVNGLLLTFMLGAGAIVGVLAARGLSVPQRRNEPVPPASPAPSGKPFQRQSAHTA